MDLIPSVPSSSSMLQPWDPYILYHIQQRQNPTKQKRIQNDPPDLHSDKCTKGCKQLDISGSQESKLIQKEQQCNRKDNTKYHLYASHSQPSLWIVTNIPVSIPINTSQFGILHVLKSRTTAALTNRIINVFSKTNAVSLSFFSFF